MNERNKEDIFERSEECMDGLTQVRTNERTNVQVLKQRKEQIHDKMCHMLPVVVQTQAQGIFL